MGSGQPPKYGYISLMGYSRKSELWTSEQMKAQEVERYEEYRQATLTLLIKHKARDLIPMLGLEDLYANPN